MINYELAKKLKEAGFPQEKSSFYYVNDKLQRVSFDSRWGGSWHTEEDMDLICAIPTLSELIEACGGKHFSLTLWDDQWICRGGTNLIAVVGSTPEEAVANLWLNLK